jgi:hypothetical protein
VNAKGNAGSLKCSSTTNPNNTFQYYGIHIFSESVQLCIPHRCLFTAHTHVLSAVIVNWKFHGLMKPKFYVTLPFPDGIFSLEICFTTFSTAPTIKFHVNLFSSGDIIYRWA